MPCVMIATPSFESRPNASYLRSLCGTQALLTERKIECHLAIMGGSPYIAESRNALASTALSRPEITDLFFIDEDLGWPPEKVIEFLQRPQEVVAGVYPKKQEDVAWPCTLDNMDGDLIECDGLFRATLVPAGFLRIRRAALERMAEFTPKYKDPNWAECDIYSFFESRSVDMEMEKLRSMDLDMLSREEAIGLLRQALGLSLGPSVTQFWGEDYWFCRRWLEMGGECWVDPDVDFAHVGFKRYTGNFATAMKRLMEG